ncbi:TspO/MBR family protein [Sphingomonas qomolangmaensis]|uniref:Tryptophan-rich sensory protein n=1 Tax=Sphingomonas qomolangmaensis TaxID=2918765 RepID=A0ABY5L8G3_9SPHN|nr:TspO/MBR family protein [Sphingomonas qomolangmaensis]UUL83082.1 tryptophan-rich sensory protein [Sphingomonas qomolangmaensis]
MTTLGRAGIFPVAIAAVAATFVAIVGATMTDLGPWYRGLAKPDWAPPDALYGVAWTLVFATTALGSVTAWRAIGSRAAADWLIGLFAFNGFLNILWSLLFFRLQRPDWAAIEVVVLGISVLGLTLFAARYSRMGAMLLLPYLGWVLLAGALNWEIVRLNGPFA